MIDLSDLQRLIIEQLAERRDRDLLISAAAGSGKTLVLVESVLASLRAGTPLDRILVVTFTDKAASEMKNKIYRELEKDPDLAPLRLRLPQAWMSTIHSFCLRLLRERFEKAKVDPRFRVLTEEDAQILLDDALRRVFHDGYAGRWGEDTTEAFEELIEMCGFDAGGERLRGVVTRLIRYARTSEDPRGFLKGHLRLLRHSPSSWADLAWAQDYPARVIKAWRYALGLLRAVIDELELIGAKSSRFAELLGKLRELDPASFAAPDAQRKAMTDLVARGIVKDPSSFHITVPSVPPGTGAAMKDVREAMGEAFRCDWLTEMPLDEESILRDERCASRLGLALIALAERVWNAYEEAKERSGCLDFEDLQIRALDLIEAAAGTDLAVRFERVFIDEFQDVNGLQHRILSRVCDPSGIFRVGDIKQSIYQFRLADPGIIRDLALHRPLIRDRSEAREDAPAWNVLLPTNYRSLRPILTVVNAIARRLFLREEIGTDYDEQALRPGGTLPSLEPPVEMLLVREPEGAEEGETEDEEDTNNNPSSAGKTDENSSLQEAEWRAIARRIRKLIDDGTQVRDPEDKNKLRPVRYSDIAVLMRTHANGPALARCLEQEGIPCSLGTGEPFFKAIEVQDLLNILRATDNLLDDIALAASLRSPAFGWEDSELLSLRLAYPQALHLAFALACLADRHVAGERFTSALLPDDPQDRRELCGTAAELPDEPPFSSLTARAAEALGRFLEWRDAAGRIELPELVARVLEETGLARSVASLPGGLRRQANLRKLFGITRRYVQDAGHNLHRFLRWLDLLQEGGAKISVAPSSSESVPAVRIATVHAAKGLEFPVVVVAEMSRRYRLGERINALVPGRRYLGVRLLEREEYLLRRPFPLRLLIDESSAEDLAEEKRVLYVALTRARDMLILCGLHKRKSVPSEMGQRTYRKALEYGDEEGRVVAQHLLASKPSPLAWILYALPPLPPPEAGEITNPADLPLTVCWVRPEAQEEKEPAANPIRAIEPVLRALLPVDLTGEADAEAQEAISRSLARPRLPSPGLLATARGKIWATEFKGGLEQPRRTAQESEDENAPDEAAVPLIAPEAAAAEGVRIHALLERLDLAGLAHENLETRIADAAARIGGVPQETASLVHSGLARLLTLPLGRALAGGAEIHREVAFSLRIPLLEVTRWLPDLRTEILASKDWTDWINLDAEGELRLRPGKSVEAADPWVLVQGRIDVVLRQPDGWTVLDWKSDRVAEAPAIDERLALYRGQLEIYRRAVENLFGRPVRAALFFLRPGILKEVLSP